MIRFISLIAVVFLSSCTALPHLDEALTLKGYSDEKDAQAAYVKSQDRKFQELAALVKSNDPLNGFQRKKNFIARFGEPVLVEAVPTEDGKPQLRLLYRRATDYFSGEKVYVFFDEVGILDRVQYVR